MPSLLASSSDLAAADIRCIRKQPDPLPPRSGQSSDNLIFQQVGATSRFASGDFLPQVGGKRVVRPLAPCRRPGLLRRGAWPTLESEVPLRQELLIYGIIR